MKPKRTNPLFAGFFRRNYLTAAVVVSLAGASSVQSVSAGTLYWDTNGATAGSGNAAGTWDSGTNWSADPAGSSATVGWTNGESAVIAAGTDGTGAYTLTLAGSVSTPSILVEEAGAKTIAGGTINIGAGSIHTAAAGNGNEFIVSSIIAGSGGLTLNANGDTSETGGGVGGMLRLTGANTISGDITINSGVVRSDSSFGNSGNKLVLNGGGIVDSNLNTNIARNIEIPATKTGVYRAYGSVATGQLSGAITGSGTLMRTDGGTVTLNCNFSAFTGTFRNAQGTTVIGTPAATTMAAIPVVQSDGGNVLRLGAAGDTTILSLVSDRDVVVPFGSRLNIANGTYTTVGAGSTFNGFWAQGTTAGTAAATGEITSSSGTLNITNGAASGNLTTTDNRIRLKIVDFNGGTPLAVTKSNQNSLSFDMVNTYTGGTTINGGRINADNVSAFGTGTVTVNSGGQAAAFASGTFANNFVINGDGVSEGSFSLGALRFGNTTVSGGISVASASRITADGATGTHSGALTGSSALAINAPGRTGTMNFTGNTGGYTGAMTLNAGTLNIGASGLGGSLTVAAGTANVNGPVTGNVSINSGRGNLNNSVGGDVNIADGAKLGGEGAVTGTLNLGTSGGADLHVNAATSGALSAGTVNLAGSNFVYLDVLPSTSGPFTVLSYTTLASGDESNFQVQPSGAYRGNPEVQHDIANSRFILELNSQARTWSNAALTGNWNTSDANWVEGDNLFFNGDDVAFTDTAVGTVNLGTGLQPLSITLSNTSGNDYTFAGGGIIGTTGIAMNGGGNLTLGGTNTFTGAINVNAGVLNLGSTGALGATSGITVASGARVNLNGQTPGGGGTTNPYSYTIAGDGGDGAGNLGAITNTGGAVYASSGIRSLTLSADAEIGGNSGRFDVGRHEGTGTYGTITGGGFTLTKVGSSELCLRAPASNITYVHNSGTMWFEDYDTASGPNAITVNATATLGTYGTRSISNNVSLAAGTTLTNLGGGTGTWTGALTLGGALNINTGGNIAIDGSIAGSGNITRTNGNTLVLQNSAAAFSGKFINNGGTLRIEANAALGTATGADVLTIAGGNTLQGGTITALASATVGSATQGITHSGTGNVFYDSGTGNTLTIAGAVAGGVTNIATQNGTVAFSNAVTLFDPANTAANLTVRNNSTVSFLSGANADVRNIGLGENGQGNNSHMNIATGATVTTTRLVTGDGGSVTSNINHTGGTLNITGTNNTNSTASSFLMGHWGGGTSTYNLSGGVLNSTAAMLSLGWDTSGANFNVSGGTANLLGINLANSRNNAASVNLTGGRINLGASGITNNTAKNVNLGGGTIGAFASWTSAKNLTLTGTGGNTTFNTLDSADLTTPRTITLSGVLSNTGGAGFTKSGAGVLSLTNAAGTFNGTATVNGGTLQLSTGALASGTVQANAGGTVQPGTISTPGAGTVASLNMNGGNAAFRVGGTPEILTVTGAFNVAAASTITALPAGPIAGPFPLTYTVIDYAGTVGGLGSGALSFSSANPHLSGVLIDDLVNTQIKVQVNAADTVVWKGNVNGNWDVNTTSNWVLSSDGVTSSKYYDFDVVTLNDTGIATPNVTLAGTISPASVTVGNTTGTYTLSGSGISGSASLAKSGAGNLTLLNNNSYGGTTTINAGTVTIGNGGTSGTLGGSGTIGLSTGATLVSNRSDAQTINRTILGGGALISSGGNLTLNASGNACDITVNSGTFFARGGGFSTAFDAGKMITINTGATLDTVTHSMGSSVGGGGDVPKVTLNGGTWYFNNEQYIRELTMTAGLLTGPGEVRTIGGSVYTVNAAATSTTIANPVNLVNALSLVVNDGAAANDLLISGNVGNSGAVTKSGAGKVVLTGTNTYSGATTINAGIVQVGNGGTTGTTGTGNITNNAELVINRSDAITVSNIIGGTGTFTQSGAGTTTLGGTNTYTGLTTVTAGVLAIDGDSISDLGGLVINGGKVDVTNNETVLTLTFGVTAQAPGTYGATGSGATFIDDTRFQGTGIVTVVGAGYSSWITGFGLSVPNQAPGADPDNDGVSNAVEWVLGGNPATGMDVSKLPAISVGGGNMVFTFKRDQDSKVAGTTVQIEVGTTLAGWPTVYNVGNDTGSSSAGVTVTDNLDGTDTITLTVAQAPDSAKFARLKVTID